MKKICLILTTITLFSAWGFGNANPLIQATPENPKTTKTVKKEPAKTPANNHSKEVKKVPVRKNITKAPTPKSTTVTATKTN